MRDASLPASRPGRDVGGTITTPLEAPLAAAREDVVVDAPAGSCSSRVTSTDMQQSPSPTAAVEGGTGPSAALSSLAVVTPPEAPSAAAREDVVMEAPVGLLARVSLSWTALTCQTVCRVGCCQSSRVHRMCPRLPLEGRAHVRRRPAGRRTWGRW